MTELSNERLEGFVNMKKQKELDLFDILEPATITIKNYEENISPFKDDRWIDSSDFTIQEVARVLPKQLSFIYCLLHEHSNLLPSERNVPGRIQELVFLDIMNNLKSRTKRDLGLERKITRLWVDNGGRIPKRKGQ